ncbi:MAG: SDR family oxidoreductase [Nevskiaceae bacterium]|nr:MAG: SDR family oxidoreductase [Nevskiaceae bacterium]TBR74848.1 MAG: SDR family oxidoreductase [Nevskiaceae bacterium]
MTVDTDIAVVTGAGSGIGRAITLRLAADGARVVAADLNLEAARQTAAEHPGRIVAMDVDIADRARVDALRDRVLKDVGTPRVLVNAAGWDCIGPFLDMDAATAEKIVTINYLGPVNLCSAFLPAMAAAGYGRVVNIASDAGRVGSSGETVYAGAKGGVIALSKSLAREMVRNGITVNCVCPGPTDTPLFQSLPEKLRAGLVKAIPLHRLAQPAEIANAVAFFVRADAGFITGQVLSVSGGLTMAG